LNTPKTEFCRVPVEVIVRYGKHIPFELFIRLSDDKLVRVANANEDVAETTKKYMDKGVKDIFASKSEYTRFVDLMNRELAQRFFSIETSTKDRMELLQNSYQVLKEVVCRFGIDEKNLSLARNMAKNAVLMISKVDQVKELFAQYKGECGNEYVKALFIGAVIMGMLEHFEWQSDAIKERIMLALFLRDITLTPEDYANLKIYGDNPKKLSQKVFNHPVEIVRMLEEQGSKDFSQDILTMIQQHHERPEGDGFPLGLDHRRITLLSAILIVADYFVDKMIESKFDLDKRMIIINEMLGLYKKGNFRRALESLDTSLA